MLNLFLYWEDNKNKPPYLNFCEKSIRKYCNDIFNVIVLNKQNMFDYLPKLRKDLFTKIEKPAHHADYIRFNILYEYGGIWLDYDYLLINSIKPILDIMEQNKDCLVGSGKVIFKENLSMIDNCPSLGFLACYNKHNIIAYQQIFEMNKLIDYAPEFKDQGWMFLGTDVLKNFIYKEPYRNKCILLDNQIMFPVRWQDCGYFFDTTKNKEIFDKMIDKEKTIGIALYNNVFPNWFKKMSESEIIDYNKSENLPIMNLLLY